MSVKNPSPSITPPDLSAQQSTAQGSFFFKTPFTPSYWRAAARELKNPKMLIIAALFIALDIVVSSLFIPVGDNLRVYFSFFVKSLGGMLYGPVVGLFTGFIGDILGYILRPDGAFFPGYILTSVTGSFLYGLCFYRARVSIVRVILNRASVILICNIGMNCLWSAILYGKGYYYYLTKSVVKNAMMLPIEIVLLFLFLRLMLPVLEKMKLRPKKSQKELKQI